MHDLTATDRRIGRPPTACASVDGAPSKAADCEVATGKAIGDRPPCSLARTLDFLRSHLADNVSLEMLAGMTGQSRSSFCRWFKTETGLSPHQWFLRARIDEAMRLLSQGAQPLSDVALAVGFTDQAHFGRTFKRVTGTSPGAWQRSRGARPDPASEPRPLPRTERRGPYLELMPGDRAPLSGDENAIRGRDHTIQ